MAQGPRRRIDTGTAAGRATLFILMSMVQCEREAIGERMVDAFAHLRAEGVPLGGAALGWRHTAATDPATGRRVLGEVEEELATVARIRALRAEGRSYAAIALQLAAEGHPTKRGGRWFPNTVRLVWMRGAVRRPGRALEVPEASPLDERTVASPERS